jgi:hypothetical protein
MYKLKIKKKILMNECVNRTWMSLSQPLTMPKHMSVVGHGIKLGSYSGALRFNHVCMSICPAFILK